MSVAAMSPISEKSGRFVDETSESADRTYAMFTHLVGLISLSDGAGLLGPIGTLIMWRIKARESHFLDDHGREAMNFQISLLIYFIVGAIALAIFTAVTFGVGAVVAVPSGGIGIAALLVLRLVGSIRGAIAASRGEYYRYPMCMRLIGEPEGPEYARA